MSCRRYFGLLNSIGSIRLQGLLKFEWISFYIMGWPGAYAEEGRLLCFGCEMFPTGSFV